MNDATYRLANLVGNALNRALKVDYHLQNAAVIPRQGAAIIACTHSSYVDFMGLLQATQVVKRFPRFMIREAVWQPSWLRPFLTNMQHISVDRQAPAAALLQARRLLNAGELV